MSNHSAGRHAIKAKIKHYAFQDGKPLRLVIFFFFIFNSEVSSLPCISYKILALSFNHSILIHYKNTSNVYHFSKVESIDFGFSDF